MWEFDLYRFSHPGGEASTPRPTVFERSFRGTELTLSGRLDDDAFFHRPGPDGHSAAILVKHLGGNLRSRWTDFPTTDGEKPHRHRDAEFELHPEDTRD